MRFRLLGLLMALIGAAALSASAQEPPTNTRIVGYFISWGIYDREYFVADIPADMLTHLNYAFANVSEEGECLVGDPEADTDRVFEGDTKESLRGNFNQLIKLKEAHPHLKTLISVGGWTWSARFSDVALTEESRQRFAASCVDFIKRYGFDGVDIDWEYPTGGGDAGNIERPQDPENFILLLAELRAQLDAASAQDSKQYLLTIAAGIGGGAIDGLDWERIHPLLDWINIMAYDMSGSWSAVTGFNAPLYNSTSNPPEGTSADAAVQAFLRHGVPADKLVLGAPFYGKGWTGVRGTNNGLHQGYEGLPAGSWEPGWFDYRDLATNYIGSGTWTRSWDETAQVPWLYDPADGVMITYDDPESLTRKAQYVRKQGLGGIMFWELSQDTADSALLSAIYTALTESGERNASNSG
ncbi:MAG: glycoside hydrolase family 18 protein [Chloroflexi bacterium]|nr:glycoside hydrolase family 18 protein [Chloroflexota bacterium]